VSIIGLTFVVWKRKIKIFLGTKGLAS
jgi:hypothetical protein